ncbi:ankyrin repeat domain-containing protein [Niabella aquatica]
MRQPHALKTEAYIPFANGNGNRVWAMICAAIGGDLESVQKLAEIDRRLLTCEYEYFTPMHFAVRENHRHIVEFLLRQGVNAVYEPGEPLLTTAADRAYTEIMGYLNAVLKEHYNISPEGNAIAEAIKNGQTQAAIALIESQDAMIAADTKGNQPMHWAVFTANYELIEYLLAHGADINAKRPDGARPIDLANVYLHQRTWHVPRDSDLFAKNNELLNFLIKSDADCDIGTAARIGDYDLVQEIVKGNPDSINAQPLYADYFSGLPLRMAAGAGYFSIAEFLLQHGARSNQAEPGVAPEGGALHAAVWGRHFDIAQRLLEHGANVDAEVESSGDAIFMAAWVKAPAGFIAALKQHSKNRLKDILEGDLIQFKAMVASNNSLAETFIDHLIREDLRDHISVLLESRADLLRHRDYDPAAWWDSFTFKSAGSARWFLEHGLPANRYNWLGITPLHRAAGSGDIAIAEILLAYGADINAVEVEWCSTPLGWAARSGQKAMVEFLLKNRALTDVKGQKTWSTPGSWAEKKGFDEITSLLNN